ncbi:MAG: HDIG domain-containing protein [Candidatus Delongbacteria bacterium]|jgi:putative nucleotidyltransferase with HDIG domain|nr:HDIG domain-containing protein [Candidatus Delongbacteria bacterium]
MNKKYKKNFANISILLVISIAATVFMLPKGKINEFSNYKIGLLAPEKVISPFDFEILRSDEELQDVRAKIRSTVHPVFIYADTLNLSLYRKYSKFYKSFDDLRAMKINLGIIKDKQNFYSAKRDSLIQNDSIGFIGNKSALDSIVIAFNNELNTSESIFKQKYYLNFKELNELPLLSNKEFRKRVGYFLRRHINDQILNTSKKSIFNRELGKLMVISSKDTLVKNINDYNDIERKNEDNLDFLVNNYITDVDNDSLKYWNRIISNFTRPNLIFDNILTERMILIAQNGVPLARGLVNKGEEIVAKNMLITKDIHEKLNSLDRKIKEKAQSEISKNFIGKINFRNIGGKTILASLFYIVLIIMLFFNRSEFFCSIKKMTLIFLLILIQLIAIYFSARYIENYSPYLVLMPVTSILIGIFFDLRTAFVGTVITTMLGSLIVGNSYTFVFIPLFSGLLTIYGVNRIRDIFQFIYKTFVYTFFGLLVPAIGFQLLLTTGNNQFGTIFLHCSINAVVTPLLALALLSLIEILFKMPTDITLLQLSDMSRPLLKKLQIEAPGTSHHSIVVGNLAEAAAEAIKANSLLARVGAYYHDIGKTFKPAYFVENQKNIGNKHDKMAPNMSALILSNHVKEGAKLANEYKLPEVIVDFIKTHHGTSRMEFFYNKAVNQAKDPEEKINESIYKYPGPKPQTKETAIVMLSDIVEAKSRTETNANIDRFRQIINEIILERLQTGELDECNLKINDLSKIREAMIPVLAGMYHSRIVYPEKNNETQQKEQKDEIS